ncbi:hypothetical protein BU24DRAFT_15431 [Aaosphaeria arxii CBS 175.79]|uniref:DUF1996 domain-containing protein n=1 Tax=Aaosphaeria arxii CBS 175.79 TaxID=1450172 RepID=A0A6A5Y8Q9_9PLEO|nr:uncharacterized protein BU24DRAFT_15431 [Aaosphaeria arxii CBS 175.79]KAF2021131.1 hypothetical protein BU24DRAFT_15431 [Aaosphaeria arxii CBS 175.79]
MLAYYLLPGEGDPGYNVTAFPKDFRMLAGDTRQRNFTGPFPDKEKSLWGPEDKTQASLAQKAIGFNCLDYSKQGEPTAYRHFLPDKAYLDANCKNGTRAEIFFPSCWDGKNNDSPNHKDHVAYPDLVNAGKCPSSHPVQLPILLYETIWETKALDGKKGQFTFANGDPTGFGYHADFMMGWKDDQFLKDAVAKCTNKSGRIEDCPVFTQNGAKGTPGQDGSFLQTEQKMQQCKFAEVQALDNDNCAGPADGLCGNVRIQPGPAYAELMKPGNPAAPTPGYTPGPSAVPSVPVLSYTTPRTVVNGISIYNIKGDGGVKSAPPEIPAAPSSSSTPSSTTASTTSAPVAAVLNVPAPTAQPPAPTPAAVVPDTVPGSVVSTKTFTSAGTVYEVAIKEVQVYVTVTATPAGAPQPPKLHRRHVHHNLHRRGHGLLRQ